MVEIRGSRNFAENRLCWRMLEEEEFSRKEDDSQDGAKTTYTIKALEMGMNCCMACCSFTSVLH